jgi:uncharacterized protein YqjF (DUF2071 family)
MHEKNLAPKTFLQAEWRKLVMINYAVDKEILSPYLPYKTEIDLWKENCYISLVGFMFLNTKVKGFQIPFHINFEEVNLRFYVRYKDNNDWKRGVVFIKEIVPRAALTLVANAVYRENYETMRMRHSWSEEGKDSLEIAYEWKKTNWNSIQVTANPSLLAIESGSEEEFITEHYWGYTKVHHSKTSEYKVEHPRWQVYPVKHHSIDVDFGDVYGEDFKFLRSEIPKSVFLAEGSEIKVLEGKHIT